MNIIDMRIECYKYTNDDFCPNFREHTVKLILMELFGGGYRVAAWGADDFGMDFDTNSKGNAEALYCQLCLMAKVNKQDLKDLGFTIF